jgi:uncharacterized protein
MSTEEAIQELYSAIESEDLQLVTNNLDKLSSMVGNLSNFIKSSYYLTTDFGYGSTFLEFAVHKQNYGIVEKCIKSGMDVNVLGGNSSPLMESITINNLEITKLIIENGADIEFRDEDNITPLMVAASHGNVEIVKLLIQSGADPNAINDYDRKAIQAAAEEGYQEVVEYLSDFTSPEEAEAAFIECNKGEGAKARKKRQKQ